MSFLLYILALHQTITYKKKAQQNEWREDSISRTLSEIMQRLDDSTVPRLYRL